MFLLKTPHALVVRCPESKLVPSWKRPPGWSTFKVLKGAVWATGEEKASLVLSSCGPYEADRPAKYDVHSCAAVAQLLE